MKMNQEELTKIIENHQHWLKGDCVGWEDMRANLSCADLKDLNLQGVIFRFGRGEPSRN